MGDTLSIDSTRQIRICVSLWACAYEFFDHSFATDDQFDATCRRVADSLHIDTDRPDLDAWFRKHFSPDTGQWIHIHPDVEFFKLLCDYRLNWPDTELTYMCWLMTKKRLNEIGGSYEPLALAAKEFLTNGAGHGMGHTLSYRGSEC